MFDIASTVVTGIGSALVLNDGMLHSRLESVLAPHWRSVPVHDGERSNCWPVFAFLFGQKREKKAGESLGRVRDDSIKYIIKYDGVGAAQQGR